MMSTNGAPQRNSGIGEEEPLLGNPGDASQRSGENILVNLWIGTAPLAQAGIWILVAIVWSGVFSADIILFSGHPILNSAGLLLVTQAILILQPTHTAAQKRHGTHIHAAFHFFGVGALIGGFIVIEVNKFRGGSGHFESIHGILGLTTYIFFVVQALVGVTQYWVPSLYGGIDNAKAVWKYHRMSGYVVLTLGFATVAAATPTGFNKTSLHIQLWAVVVASVLVLAGLLPRIKLQKLGIKQ